MSIDVKLNELIAAMNRVAESNMVLAQAYTTMAGASDNGPKATRAAAPKPATAAPAAAAASVPELPGEPLPPAVAPVLAPEAAAAPALQIQDVRAALLALPDKNQVPALLAKFGCAKLSEIPAERYAEVIAAAKAQAATAPGTQDPLL